MKEVVGHCLVEANLGSRDGVTGLQVVVLGGAGKWKKQGSIYYRGECLLVSWSGFDMSLALQRFLL